MLSVPLDLKINRGPRSKCARATNQSGIPARGCPPAPSRTSPARTPALPIGPPGVTSATFIDGQEGVQPAFAGPYASCRALKSNVSTNAIVPTYTHHIVRHLVMCHSQLIGN